MEAWRTGIVKLDEKNIWIRGYDIGSLMRRQTFAGTIFLLHQGRLPSEGESRLLDAILISAADHGPGAPSAAAARVACSGNRKALSSAIAAGILAIGDEHAGAGEACMAIIAAGTALVKAESISLEAAAERAVDAAAASKKRLPGLGHRQHTVDPRKDVLFSMAREYGLARDGVAFMLALEKAASEKIKPLPLNIDGVLAAILYDLGFPAEFGKLVFIIARVGGLTAEICEELSREKAMRIHIPVVYDGPPPREMP
jgi:citrate synthase